MAQGREVTDAGDAAVRIVAVIVLVGDERANCIWIVAEHRFPSAKREWIKRNETQNEIQEEEEKH